MIATDLTEVATFFQILQGTPRRLQAYAQGLDPARLNYKDSHEAWSANDILAHLRACASVWGGCIQSMLSQEHPTIRYISPRTYIRKTDYLKQEFIASLEAFTHQREALLVRLHSLETQDWDRWAMFDDGHKLRKQTVFDTVRRLAKHESEHCAQIESLLDVSP
jgi:uncharacterized damage-inducible protein DinB